MMNRSLLFSIALVLFCGVTLHAQSDLNSKEEVTQLCIKAGFEIKSKSESFDVYKYQKAFLKFDRIDQFRKENEPNTFSLENGEATITLVSASEMMEKHGGKSSAMGDKLPPLRFVLNVNGQVKEQPLN